MSDYSNNDYRFGIAGDEPPSGLAFPIEFFAEPVVATYRAYPAEEDEFYLRAYVNSDGDVPSGQCRFDWGATIAMNSSTSWEWIDYNAIHSSQITTVDYNQKYYYRAYYSTNTGTEYNISGGIGSHIYSPFTKDGPANDTDKYRPRLQFGIYASNEPDYNYNPYAGFEFDMESSGNRGVLKKVRPFLTVDVTDSSPVNPECWYGTWYPTGASTYKVKLTSGNRIKFWVDGALKSNDDVSAVNLRGYTFGLGNSYPWDRWKMQIIDSSFSGSTVTGDFMQISGSLTSMQLAQTDEYMYVNTGSTWVAHTDKKASIYLGWKYSYIDSHISSNSSISAFGYHPYTITEPLLATQTDVDVYAQRLLDTYVSGLSNGSIVINGRTDVNISEYFTLNLSQIGINDNFSIEQYTHIIDQDGFKTKIDYGSKPYDIARKVSILEREVFGGPV